MIYFIQTNYSDTPGVSRSYTFDLLPSAHTPESFTQKAQELKDAGANLTLIFNLTSVVSFNSSHYSKDQLTKILVAALKSLPANISHIDLAAMESNSYYFGFNAKQIMEILNSLPKTKQITLSHRFLSQIQKAGDNLPSDEERVIYYKSLNRLFDFELINIDSDESEYYAYYHQENENSISLRNILKRLAAHEKLVYFTVRDKKQILSDLNLRVFSPVDTKSLWFAGSRSKFLITNKKWRAIKADHFTNPGYAKLSFLSKIISSFISTVRYYFNEFKQSFYAPYGDAGEESSLHATNRYIAFTFIVKQLVDNNQKLNKLIDPVLEQIIAYENANPLVANNSIFDKIPELWKLVSATQIVLNNDSDSTRFSACLAVNNNSIVEYALEQKITAKQFSKFITQLRSQQGMLLLGDHKDKVVKFMVRLMIHFTNHKDHVLSIKNDIALKQSMIDHMIWLITENEAHLSLDQLDALVLSLSGFDVEEPEQYCIEQKEISAALQKDQEKRNRIALIFSEKPNVTQFKSSTNQQEVTVEEVSKHRRSNSI